MRLTAVNVILVVTLVFGAAVGSAYVIYSALTKDARVAASVDTDYANSIVIDAQRPGPTLELGAFTVNLAGGNRYLRTEIVLELTERQSVKELEERFPQVRDHVNAVIRSFSANELFEPGGDARLKQQIIETLNPLLSRGRVTGVYFTTWVVQ